MAAPHGPTPRAARLTAVDRRSQLAHLAGRRFHRLGYHRVSLGDVAEEAGITAPAVYRHFRNKEALLAAAIGSGLDLVEDAVSRGAAGSLDDLVVAVAEAGLRRPDMWVLLQRESRFLGPELRDPVQQQFARIVDGFSRRLRKERPELAVDDARLLVTAATAVLSLPSTTYTSLAPDAYLQELTEAALACLRADPGAAGPAPDITEPAEEPPVNRREQVVDTAVALFSRRGYGGVSLDDIGAAVGIAGPSILHHFTTKSEILVVAFDRAVRGLATAQERRRSGRPSVRDLVAGYIAFALANRDLLGVSVSESLHLPADAFAATMATVRAELGDWTRALLAAAPDLDEPVARMRVRAALIMVNDLVRLGSFARRPRIAAEIELLAAAVLQPGIAVPLRSRAGKGAGSAPGSSSR